jgi:hypothetical protein
MAAGLRSIVLSKITAALDDNIDSIFRYPHNRNTDRFRVVTEPIRISAPSHGARDKAPRLSLRRQKHTDDGCLGMKQN